MIRVNSLFREDTGLRKTHLLGRLLNAGLIGVILALMLALELDPTLGRYLDSIASRSKVSSPFTFDLHQPLLALLSLLTILASVFLATRLLVSSDDPKAAVQPDPAAVYEPLFAPVPGGNFGLKLEGLELGDFCPETIKDVHYHVNQASDAAAKLHLGLSCFEGCVIISVCPMGPPSLSPLPALDLAPEAILAALPAHLRRKVTGVRFQPSSLDAPLTLSPPAVPGGPSCSLVLSGLPPDFTEAEAPDFHPCVWSSALNRELRLPPGSFQLHLSGPGAPYVALRLPSEIQPLDALKVALKRVPPSPSASSSSSGSAALPTATARVMLGPARLPVLPAPALSAALLLPPPAAASFLPDLALILETVHYDLLASGTHNPCPIDCLASLRALLRQIKGPRATPLTDWLEAEVLPLAIRARERARGAEPHLPLNSAQGEEEEQGVKMSGLLTFSDPVLESRYQSNVARYEGIEEVVLYATLLPVFLLVKAPSIGMTHTEIFCPMRLVGIAFKCLQALLILFPVIHRPLRKYLVILSALDCINVEADLAPYAAKWMLSAPPSRFLFECVLRLTAASVIATFRRVPVHFYPIKFAVHNGILALRAMQAAPGLTEYSRTFLYASLGCYMAGDLIGTIVNYVREKNQRIRFLHAVNAPLAPAPSPHAPPSLPYSSRQKDE